MSSNSNSPDSATGRRWRAVPASELAWAGWQGDFVLYQRPSGKTHFVNAATALLLQEVLVEPCTAAAAARALAAAQSLPADDAFVAEVEDLLARLEDLGLVNHEES